MRKFLENCDLEDYFESQVLYRGKEYYMENRILDVWYSGNTITAYISGSSIYRVILTIKNNEIINSYCGCPYSDGGEYMCKHIAAVMCHISNEEIPELESNKKIERETTKLEKIYDKINYELNKITDKNEFVNYYNGRYFVDLIQDVSNYIDEFIDNEEYQEAFELIKYTYQFINDLFMDGSNGKYQESFYIINESASKLLYNDEYYEIFLDYAYNIAGNNVLGYFSDAPIHVFVLYVHDEESARKVIDVLDNTELGYGIFVNAVLDKIELTYEYISKTEAINLCYKNIDKYGVKDLLIDYLKKEGKIDEVINILKDDVKNHVRNDYIYDKLLDVYDEFNMLEEKKKILPKIIVETANFRRFKELKDICSELEWKDIRDSILSKVDKDKKYFLEEVYNEENEPDKLFDLVKQNPSLFELSKYQNCLKDKYSKELLRLYKPLILEEARIVSNRNSYYELCRNIKFMDKLNDSNDFIFEMIEEMYPYFKSKKAFKEEIMKVLNSQNKARFIELIQK